MTTRVFTKTILPDKLQVELTDILTDSVMDFVDFEIDTDKVTVHLKVEPTSAQDQDITDTVNNHVPSYPGYKIWDYVNDEPHVPWFSPTSLDYKKGLNTRLHPKNTFTKGELTLREYYESATVDAVGAVTFSNLVLKEENSYTRDIGGFAVVRSQTISWMRDDETWGPDVKTTLKYYSGIDKMQEGKKRRSNLVDQLMMDTANMLLYIEAVARITATGDPNYQLTQAEVEAVLVTGRDLLTAYEDEFSAFIQHSEKKILTDIANDTTHAILDYDVPGSSPVVKIRDFVISEMTI